MKRGKRLSATVLSLALSMSVLGVIAAGPALAHCVSPAGTYYQISTNHGPVLDGGGAPDKFQNLSSNSIYWEFSQTEAKTVQWSVNASISGTAGFNFWVIKASVEAKVGGSYTTSTYTSKTWTLRGQVPPHLIGILQGGALRTWTYGHYWTDNGQCGISNDHWINTKIVQPGQTYAYATNTTGNPPWDQGNV